MIKSVTHNSFAAANIHTSEAVFKYYFFILCVFVSGWVFIYLWFFLFPFSFFFLPLFFFCCAINVNFHVFRYRTCPARYNFPACSCPAYRPWRVFSRHWNAQSKFQSIRLLAIYTELVKGSQSRVVSQGSFEKPPPKVWYSRRRI